MKDQKRHIPEYIVGIYGSARNFKATKRAQLFMVEHALKEYLKGCAYAPGEDVGTVLAKVREWRRLSSVKEWGR